MRHVGPTRREIGIRTVFNILGPLTNPAGARYQVLGVADAGLLRLMGEALLRLGCDRALIVHGDDGMDELSLSAPTHICEVRGQEGDLLEYAVTPEEVGMTARPREAVQGGDAERNALLLRDVLSGQMTGAPAEMVALNAGAALYIAGQAESISDGARLAGEGLRAGRAIPTLEALITTSRALAASVA